MAHWKGERGRGQTGVDFLIGIGVFLLTVGFVTAFVPGLLTPFADHPERPLVADRAVDTVVGSLFVESDSNTVETACTLAFFGVGSDAGCPFDASETTSETALPDALGLPTATRVNVTLERTVSGATTRAILCGVETPTPSVQDCSQGGTPLAVGPSATTTGSVVVSSRTVYVDGRDAVVVVRVW